MVPTAGVEPARPKAGDFKSPVSTVPPRGPRALGRNRWRRGQGVRQNLLTRRLSQQAALGEERVQVQRLAQHLLRLVVPAEAHQRQRLARHGGDVARVDLERALQVGKRGGEVLPQEADEGALVVALGVVGTVLDQLVQDVATHRGCRMPRAASCPRPAVPARAGPARRPTAATAGRAAPAPPARSAPEQGRAGSRHTPPRGPGPPDRPLARRRGPPGRGGGAGRTACPDAATARSSVKPTIGPCPSGQADRLGPGASSLIDCIAT